MLPRAISTYGGQATLKAGVLSSCHAIVYGGDKAPEQLDGEGLTLRPIRVEMTSNQTLSPISRLNFGKIYNIEHYLPVKSLGMVSAKSMTYLKQNFKYTMSEENPNAYGSLSSPAISSSASTPRTQPVPPTSDVAFTTSDMEGNESIDNAVEDNDECKGALESGTGNLSQSPRDTVAPSHQREGKQSSKRHSSKKKGRN
jgi:hypothetical protein